MVAAELAVAIPALVVVLVLALGALQVGVDQVRCVDAARLAARALARGDSPGAASSAAVRAAPNGASVAIRAGPQEVTVVVSVSAHLGPWRAFEVTSSASAAKEQP